MDSVCPTPPHERPLQSRSRFYFRFFYLAIASNLLALLVAWLDRSWIAFGIAMVWGPALNACLILGALLLIPRARQHQRFSLGKHLAISMFVPAAAAVFDYLIIFSMSLHGC